MKTRHPSYEDCIAVHSKFAFLKGKISPSISKGQEVAGCQSSQNILFYTNGLILVYAMTTLTASNFNTP